MQCFSGDKVAVTLTNLGTDEGDEIVFAPRKIVWKVTTEESDKGIMIVHQEKVKNELRIKKENSHTWLWPAWNTEDNRPLDDGIYRICRAVNPETVKEIETKNKKFYRLMRKLKESTAEVYRVLLGKKAKPPEVEAELLRKLRVKEKQNAEPIRVALVEDAEK